MMRKSATVQNSLLDVSQEGNPKADLALKNKLSFFGKMQGTKYDKNFKPALAFAEVDL